MRSFIILKDLGYGGQIVTGIQMPDRNGDRGCRGLGGFGHNRRSLAASQSEGDDQ